MSTPDMNFLMNFFNKKMSKSFLSLLDIFIVNEITYFAYYISGRACPLSSGAPSYHRLIDIDHAIVVAGKSHYLLTDLFSYLVI